MLCFFIKYLRILNTFPLPVKRNFVNWLPTSKQTSHIPHPTSHALNIPNIPHPKHRTTQTSHISNIPRPEHPIS